MDLLPYGLSYIAGSTRMDGQPVADGSGGTLPLVDGIDINAAGSLPGIIPKGREVVVTFRVRILAGPVNEFLGTAAGVVVLWYGGRQVLQGEIMRPEEFMTYIIAIFLLMQPIKSLSKVHNQIQQGLAAADRVFAVMDTPPRIRESTDAIDVDDLRQSVRFRDVVFQYDTGERVLDHIDLELRRGEVIALVGASGRATGSHLHLEVRVGGRHVDPRGELFTKVLMNPGRW